MMKRLLSLILTALIAPAFAADLAPLALDGRLWQMDKAALGRELRSVFGAAVDDNTLRLPAQKNLSLGQLNPGEVLIRFDEGSGHVRLLQVSLYNKGDDGKVDKKQFEARLDAAAEQLDSLTGVHGKTHKVFRRDSGVKLNARIWQAENAAWLLEVAGSGKSRNFSAEFIRLSIGPDAEALERGGAHDAAHRSALRHNCRKDEEGNACIEGIPMVDQGTKGYCVPATASRVFAYYGMDGVDQHALAALAKSSGSRGTSVGTMESALRDISSSFHIKVIELDKGGYGEFISSYNATAKKLKKPSVTPSKKKQVLIFDPAVLLEAHAAKPAQVRKWLAPIKKSIDEGLPILWSVQMAFPEGGRPAMHGGHMRLIIGYNEEKDTIIYSDSWGAGHERKEMPTRQACAMSVCRYILRPTR